MIFNLNRCKGSCFSASDPTNRVKSRINNRKWSRNRLHKKCRELGGHRAAHQPIEGQCIGKIVELAFIENLDASHP